jgi:ABC-type polysaccharide/polyol phosphate export permease
VVEQTLAGHAAGKPTRDAEDPGSSRGDGSPRSVTRATEPRPEIWFRRRVGLRAALRELWHFRELIHTLAERDLKARYKQTLLGAAWAIITPLLLMLVFTLVFTRFKVNTNGIPYPVFSYLALIPWTFFSAAVLGGGLSVVSNLAIVNKVYCPREIFPISSLALGTVDALVSSTVLGVLFAVTGTAPHIQALFAPLLIAVLYVFSLGIALIASSALVYLRDLRHALPIVVQLLLFLTPVAYAFDAIATTQLRAIAYSAVNPVAAVIDGLRRTVLLGLQPEWIPLGAAASTSVLVLFFGYFLFKRLETGFADFA